jgi:hypothetical protein
MNKLNLPPNYYKKIAIPLIIIAIAIYFYLLKPMNLKKKDSKHY